jgi:vacuolar-type H+-ATPase subunit F/Vma7
MTMAQIAAIGEAALIEGYGLAGVTTTPADDPTAVREAWLALDPEVAVVILTPGAADVVAAGQRGGVLEGGRLIAVLPAVGAAGQR